MPKSTRHAEFKCISCNRCFGGSGGLHSHQTQCVACQWVLKAATKLPSALRVDYSDGETYQDDPPMADVYKYGENRFIPAPKLWGSLADKFPTINTPHVDQEALAVFEAHAKHARIEDLLEDEPEI